MGARGAELWWQIHEELERSLEAMLERRGAPALVLLTGDLTFQGDGQKGDKGEFQAVDAFLGWLLERLQTANEGQGPIVIAVPGNHDLVRPQGRDAWPYRVLDHYGQGADHDDLRLLQKALWDDRDVSFLDPPFGNYRRWFDASIQPRIHRDGVVLHRSYFPGDLSVEINLPGRVPLLVVGLNSAWLQYDGKNFEGRLVLSLRQFQAALPTPAGGSPLAVFKPERGALLLMHHPLSWLSEGARAEFLESIYPPHRFVACLHGHMHKARSRSEGISGGQPRHYFQAPSLFGLEHYGTARETRAMGCAWEQLDAHGEIRVWPLRRMTRGGGEAAFDWDQDFPGSLDDGVVIRPADAPPDPSQPKKRKSSTSPRKATPVAPPSPIADVELDAYRDWALDRYGGVDLLGVGGEDLRLSLADVYVPLRISRRSPLTDLEARRGPQRLAVQEEALGDVALEDTLRLGASHAPHVAIFGEPGAGKTTALYKLLHHCLTDGPESLGLAPGTLPVFLRLRRLTSEALHQRPLDAFVEQELAELSAQQLPEGLGLRLWQRGKLLLLLDGLDEVADNVLRTQVCGYLERTLTGQARRAIRAVVSSRYAGYGGEVRLSGRFLHLDVRPLDAALVRQFVGVWFREAHRFDNVSGPCRQRVTRIHSSPRAITPKPRQHRSVARSAAMKLSLPEAATALGQSERQVRYLIKTGRLKAHKDGGRWSIDSADLPLTEAQRGAIASKVEVARAAFEKGLEPAEKAASPEEKRRYSVTDLQAFQLGEPLYRELLAAFGIEDPACRHLFEALELLTRGCHAFQPSEKAARFTEAREAAACAAIHLILGSADSASSQRRCAERIEQELIPRIASLVASQERRSRRDRFERFGGVLGGRSRGR